MLPQQGIASIVDTDNCFTFETTSYRMKVSFLQNKLTVTLQDLIDFVVYSKVFADDKQINKRVTLQDIFYSLTEATHGKVKTDEVPNIYQFGSLIQKDGVPYYKVQSGGRITVYVSMFDRRKKQQVNFDSSLKLQKVREMSQLQIVKQKSSSQKRKLLAQISVLKRQKTEIAVKLQERGNKINQLTGKLDQKTRQYTESAKKLVISQEISMKQYKFLKRSAVDGYSQSIFNKIIPFNQVYTFRVKIVTAPSKYVGIGVVDYEKHKTVSCYYNTNFIVAYYWWYDNQGHKYPSGAVEGIGYKQGEIVQVRVDLANRTINWSVNGERRATHTHEMLGDESKIFMPFVQVHYRNTEIQWFG